MYAMIKGDLWDYHLDHWVAVTTNLGWKPSGDAVMGAGVARQARDRYPDLAWWYGARCRHRMANDELADLYYPKRLVMLPTKSTNFAIPHLSWKQKSTLEFIERSLQSMVRVCEAYDAPGIDAVYLPPPGCGHGGLLWQNVQPLVERVLGPSRIKFIVVMKEKSWL